MIEIINIILIHRDYVSFLMCRLRFIADTCFSNSIFSSSSTTRGSQICFGKINSPINVKPEK